MSNLGYSMELAGCIQIRLHLFLSTKLSSISLVAEHDLWRSFATTQSILSDNETGPCTCTYMHACMQEKGTQCD